MKAILAITTAAALCAGWANAAAPPAPDGTAARGRQLFVSVGCYQCHGTSGEGGSDRTAPRVAPNPLPYGFYLNQLRAPVGRMPIYTAAILPEQDAADIYAFMRSIAPPRPVSEIPLLNR